MSDQPVLVHEETFDEAAWIVARDVSFDDYMARYAHDFHEWVEPGGVVFKMSPIHIRHDEITAHLRLLLKAYFSLRPIGRVIGAPFVMRLRGISAREPDLQVLVGASLARLKPTYVDGPADICIEIVSPGSIARDQGVKLGEYERGGVGEYWIIDSLHEEARFFRRLDGRFIAQTPDADGVYRTPLLPGFGLHVPTLWVDAMPDAVAILDEMRARLAAESGGQPS
jgi:Uma2 family endonuclease